MAEEGYVREVAHRVFAAEFNEATLQVRDGEDQYAPQYLLTPTGAKCNRVFVVGVLTEKEDKGKDGTSFWVGRIVDPTGVFTVIAGQYNPEAAQALAKTASPEYVAIVGKPYIKTDDGGDFAPSISIRAEYIQVVDADTRDRWVVDAAKQTKARLKKLQGTEPDVVTAREHYSTNEAQYNDMVTQALESLRAE